MSEVIGNFRATIRFQRHYTGEEIRSAVQRAAGSLFLARHRYDDGELYQLGRRCSHGQYDFLVIPAGDGEDEFQPDATYTAVQVVDVRAEGRFFAAVVIPSHRVVAEGEDFVARLREQLEVTS